MVFVISAEKILSEPLFWRFINLATLGWSHFHKKLWVLRVNISKTNFPGEAHVYSHRRKAIDCDKCGNYFITSPVLKMHKFCRSGAKPFFKGKLQALRENISKTIFPGVPGESYVYSHRRKALQNKRRIVIRVENILSNPRSWKCTNFTTVGPQNWHVY